MANPQALIVDDEQDIRELIELTLTKMGIDCTQAEDVHSAKITLSSQSFDLCFSDMRLPDGTGLELLDHMRQKYPHIPVAILTAFGNVDLAVTALKAGAFDFVSKPVNLQQLRELANTALKLNQTPKASPNTQSHSQSSPELDEILGTSPEVIHLKKQVVKLARSQAPVYIHGESGSGKELVASMIHQLSPRGDGPFIPVNCGAIPAELMESEFFGHKKGSFTGATTDKEGLFLAAKGGTLFLDEVADLPLHMQVKLLRSIQEKAVRPVGGNAEIATDVRILSATHKDLEQMVAKGQFRQDLFYRINVIQLEVPPLRERIMDIMPLTHHFLAHISEQWGIDTPQLADDAVNALETYSYPGNIRELQNILERAMTFSDSDTIHAEHLELNTQRTDVLPPSTLPATAMSITNESWQLPPNTNLEDYLSSIEIKVITDALEKHRWNRTATAKALGLSFRSLRYRLKKLNIDN